MRALAIAILCVACGKPSEDSSAPAGSAPPPPPKAPEPVKPVAPPDAPDAPLPTCVELSQFAGATVTGGEVHYCLREKVRTCWALAADGKVRALPLASALDPHGAELVFAEPPDPMSKEPPPAPPKLDDSKVCGSGCPPLAIVPEHGATDDEEGDHAVSASGAREAVVRGSPDGKQMVDVYDRATGKRIGVARSKTCLYLEGFAGETAVAQEWDCANQGGDRVLVGPTAKVVARIDCNCSHGDMFDHVDGDRWAFSDRSRGAITVYDVVTGKRLAQRDKLEQRFVIRAGNGRVYRFDENGALTVSGPDLKTIVTGAPPLCP